MEMDSETLYLSLIVGVILTLLFGLIPFIALTGGTNYGLPTAWIDRVVLAQKFEPWRIRWTGFILDTIYWAIIVFLVFKIHEKVRYSAIPSVA
jgi:hypothetical protein